MKLFPQGTWGVFIPLFLTCGFSPSLTWAEKNVEWSSQDSTEAIAFIQGFTLHPEFIDTLITGSMKRDHDLGFGFMLREVWKNPAGKLGFSAKIIYQKNAPLPKVRVQKNFQVMSFEIKPVCNYQELNVEYQKILSPVFKVRATKKNTLNILPYYWNFEKTSQPLLSHKWTGLLEDSISSKDVLRAIENYMSPYSGTLYGISGGDNNQLLENRSEFLKIKELVQADRHIVRRLLRSINPATRLTAVEYILQHQESFPDFSMLQTKVFPNIFANPKQITSLSTSRNGSRETLGDSRTLCQKLSKRILTETEITEFNNLGVLRMY